MQKGYIGVAAPVSLLIMLLAINVQQRRDAAGQGGLQRPSQWGKSLSRQLR
jgi:hypothetical protein